MSLLIGKHIKDVLYSDEEIISRVERRIYPLVIPEGTPGYPFIVFQNLGVQPDYTKDGSDQDDVSVQITVIGKKYDESVELANIVRYDFEGLSADYKEFTVNECEVSSSGEEYVMEVDAYAVKIVFNFKTNDK